MDTMASSANVIATSCTWVDVARIGVLLIAALITIWADVLWLDFWVLLGGRTRINLNGFDGLILETAVVSSVFDM